MDSGIGEFAMTELHELTIYRRQRKYICDGKIFENTDRKRRTLKKL